uniref:Uncharacterized protein n=1 Tax=Avena sativa TaxID=4498 RepID=A0ACD5YCR4_AVESA
MKTLHREAQLAREKTAPAPEPKSKGALVVEAFTGRELDAAEQLIHLSASSASSGTPRARSRRAPAGSGASYTSRSVGAPPAPVPAPVPAGAVLLGGCVDWEEDEEQEVAGTQRRVKRYRLIAEIYAATEGI